MYFEETMDGMFMEFQETMKAMTWRETIKTITKRRGELYSYIFKSLWNLCSLGFSFDIGNTPLREQCSRGFLKYYGSNALADFYKELGHKKINVVKFDVRALVGWERTMEINKRFIF